jgi:hypothetical protein
VAVEFLACQIITLPRWQVKDDSSDSGRPCGPRQASQFRHAPQQPNLLPYGYFSQSLFIVAQVRALCR